MTKTKDSEMVNDVRGAEFIDYSPKTLRNYRSSGKGPPYYKIGRKILYKREELLTWVEKHRIDPEVEVA